MLENTIEKFKIYSGLGIDIKVFKYTKKEFKNSILRNNNRLREEIEDSYLKRFRNLYRSYRSYEKENDFFEMQDAYDNMIYYIERTIVDLNKIKVYIFKDTSLEELESICELLDFIIKELTEDEEETEHFSEFAKLFYKDESLHSKMNIDELQPAINKQVFITKSRHSGSSLEEAMKAEIIRQRAQTIKNDTSRPYGVVGCGNPISYEPLPVFDQKIAVKYSELTNEMIDQVLEPDDNYLI